MKRLGLAVALLVAAIVVARSSWHQGCILLERYSLEWYMNGCFYGEPDPPPGGNEG